MPARLTGARRPQIESNPGSNSNRAAPEYFDLKVIKANLHFFSLPTGVETDLLQIEAHKKRSRGLKFQTQS